MKLRSPDSVRQVLIVAAIIAWCLPVFFEQYEFTVTEASVTNTDHREAILAQAHAHGMPNTSYRFGTRFIRDLKGTLSDARDDLQSNDGQLQWPQDTYLLAITRESGTGPLSRTPLPFLLLWIGIAIWSAGYFILRHLKRSPGDNNHVTQTDGKQGLAKHWQSILVLIAVVGFAVYGYFSSGGNWVFPVVTLIVAGCIYYLVQRTHNAAQSENRRNTRWGIVLGVSLILFYIVLYWMPWYVMPWIRVTDPVSRSLNGGPASQWFLYGFLYTVVIVVFGARMYARYRDNRYQLFRTTSVIFFQVAFAFLIPEFLIRMNQPYFDFKNIWPLNYSFFFDYNLRQLIEGGNLGFFMLFWGVVLIIVAVPLFTYLYGKRWYCSWVCGCGGLAETAGDPFRHLSDKSLRAWKYERWIIYCVLVFAVVMTAGVLYTFLDGSSQVLFIDTYALRGWYGFLIGSAFAGVIGTGFYPLMGSRVWCRFGCPLAAYIGLIQRFRSRFRITVNGGQCISCGNCSTYCEMGIDVRHYAQRGQDIVRASCVGCGICADVCPRGVLRLENASSDITSRADDQRTVHIREGDVRLLA